MRIQKDIEYGSNTDPDMKHCLALEEFLSLRRIKKPDNTVIPVPDHQGLEVAQLEGAESLGQGRLAGSVVDHHLQPGHGLHQGVAALPAHLGQDVRRDPEQHQQARDIADFWQFTLQL